VVAAVRFSDDAAIGKGFWTSAHGGAVETALDEVTAELAKIGIAPLAYTIDAQFSVSPSPRHHSTSHKGAEWRRGGGDGIS
jgi:hypothetical protein